MKLLVILLSVAILASTFPATAWANGDRPTPVQERSYAERESDAPALENFRGGMHEIVFILVVVAAVAIVLILVSAPFHTHHHGCGHDVIRP